MSLCCLCMPQHPHEGNEALQGLAYNNHCSQSGETSSEGEVGIYIPEICQIYFIAHTC